jgi:cytochrome b-561
MHRANSTRVLAASLNNCKGIRFISSKSGTISSVERRPNYHPMNVEENDEDIYQAPPSELDPLTMSQQVDYTFLFTLQKYCGIAAQLLAVLCILVVGTWVHALGGLGWRHGHAALTFNWHPLFMTTAFALMTAASLAFRYPISSDRRWVKLGQHGLLWLLAALCGALGIVGVFRSHNDPISGLIANLYSTHSWMGAGVIVAYILQFTVGAVSFGGVNTGMSSGRKRAVLQVHSFVGPSIYLATAVTILLGIQEKEGFVKCSYPVLDVKFLPELAKIPLPCRISHSLAILIVIVSALTLFALHNFAPARDVTYRRIL